MQHFIGNLTICEITRRGGWESTDKILYRRVSKGLGEGGFEIGVGNPRAPHPLYEALDVTENNCVRDKRGVTYSCGSLSLGGGLQSS